MKPIEIDEEIEAMKVAAVALQKLDREARLRALAFMVDREMGCHGIVSGLLYQEARKARASEKPAVSEKGR